MQLRALQEELRSERRATPPCYPPTRASHLAHPSHCSVATLQAPRIRIDDGYPYPYPYLCPRRARAEQLQRQLAALAAEEAADGGASADGVPVTTQLRRECAALKRDLNAARGAREGRREKRGRKPLCLSMPIG